MSNIVQTMPIGALPRDSVLARALDPADPSVNVVAWPGRRIRTPLVAGDIVLRQPLAGPVRSYILTRDVGSDGLSVSEAVDVNAAIFGGPMETSIRLHGPDRMLRDDLTILRVGPWDGGITGGEDASEMLPPSPTASRPTIRQGSRGPAVTDAQQRMNRIDSNRLARGQSRIDRCPLVVDGIFGSNTRAATISFQKLAFTNQPNEWDGIIGPKTWAQLDAWSFEQPIEPPTPTPPNPPPPPPNILPIIPVVDRPLDPERWGPLLRPLLSPDAQLRSGNAVRSLIDGRETFEQMEIDINSAKGKADYIYLLGWDMTDDFDLVPKDPTQGVFPNACPIGGKESKQGRNIIRLLQAASDRDVQIRMMLWAKPPLAGSVTVTRVNLMKNGVAIRDDETANKTEASTQRLRAALIAAQIAPALIPIIIAGIRPDLVRMTGAHHQKVLVVKRGETLVAYCGGIDINVNRLYSVSPKKGDPQHDTHCRIVGPSAWDLLETFIRRWTHHPKGAAIESDPKNKTEKLRGAREPVPTPIKQPNVIDAMGLGTCSVIIARTFNPVHNRAKFRVERDIQRLILRSIAAANRFIYIEDQYLFDYPDPKFPKTLDVASALNRAIPNIQHLTILIPANGLAVPFVDGHYRKNFIETVLSGLSSTDRAKVGVFEPSHSQSKSQIGCHDYVHSKSWVFDDELAVIGSANCNRRGYQHDSEVNAFIFDDPASLPTAGPMIALREQTEQVVNLRQTFAQRYRARLWQEHLRVSKGLLMDGVTSAAFWRKATRSPGARVIDFDINATSTRISKAQAEALREFIDPVP